MMLTFLSRRLLPTLAIGFLASNAHAADATLAAGRYSGFIEARGGAGKLAATIDLHVVQPSDPDSAPTLNAILKVELGGFHSPEYFSESFKHVHYDSNSGRIELEDQANDLIVVGTAGQNDRIAIDGQIWSRSSSNGTAATLHLVHENEDADSSMAPGAEFVPVLRGRYEGLCDGHLLALQISTGKGLGSDAQDAHGFQRYAVNATLAVANPALCGLAGDGAGTDSQDWCVTHTFTRGELVPFSLRLGLAGDSATATCNIGTQELTCSLSAINGPCRLTKKATEPLPSSRRFDRRFHVTAAADQLTQLPLQSLAELTQSVNGQFRGYLHHEANDSYQPLALNVIATISTDNPHSGDMVFVSSSATLQFGTGAAWESFSQAFDRRPFLLSQGFTLDGENTDGFLQISSWRQGYIAGTWYSKAYGRVGTVELVKGDLPQLYRDAVVVQPVSGQFDGPAVARDPIWQWTAQFLAASSPAIQGDSFVTFSGKMALTGADITAPLPRGTYDFYANSVAWLSQEDAARLGTGWFERDTSLKAFWPGAAHFGVRLSPFEFNAYDSKRSPIHVS